MWNLDIFSSTSSTIINVSSMSAPRRLRTSSFGPNGTCIKFLKNTMAKKKKTRIENWKETQISFVFSKYNTPTFTFQKFLEGWKFIRKLIQMLIQFFFCLFFECLVLIFFFYTINDAKQNYFLYFFVFDNKRGRTCSGLNVILLMGNRVRLFDGWR